MHGCFNLTFKCPKILRIIPEDFCRHVCKERCRSSKKIRNPSTKPYSENINYADSLAVLSSGDHSCLIYNSEEEHAKYLTHFIKQGLKSHEKVIYLVDNHTASNVINSLMNDGFDGKPYLENGQLLFKKSQYCYTREDVFDPDKMITLLKKEIDNCLDQGYSGLRIIGEMTWALKGIPGSEKLVEYEAKLNKFFKNKKCVALCQYDQKRFDKSLLLDVIGVHPINIINEKIYYNDIYKSATDIILSLEK
jgi:hypothetical protein